MSNIFHTSDGMSHALMALRNSAINFKANKVKRKKKKAVVKEKLCPHCKQSWNEYFCYTARCPNRRIGT